MQIGKVAGMSTVLQAAAARTVITPPLGTSLAGSFDDRKATEVHDDLYAHALVLESDGRRVALVSLDLICLPDRHVAAARKRIAARAGIPPDGVLIACTHTHSGPATAGVLGVDADVEYLAWLPARIADAVESAAGRLRPAVLGSTSGCEDRLTFNRRFRMRDGTVYMNPGVGNPDIVSPAGPIDPEIGLLYVEGTDGIPLALVVNFALHYVDLDSATEISAGYFAEVADLMRRVKGPAFETIYLNGACGDINNLDVHYQGTARQFGHTHARGVAGVMAGSVLRQIELLELGGEAELAAARVPLTLERKTITPEDLQIARRILAGEPIPTGGPFSWVRGMPIHRGQVPTYARECLLLAEMPPVLETEVQALRIGDTGVVALPGEIFVEIGLAIKAASPLARTLVATLANGYVGYLCTDKALAEGSYETWAARSSLPAAGSEGRLREAAKVALGAVASGGRATPTGRS
jgi:hypothetical protein